MIQRYVSRLCLMILLILCTTLPVAAHGGGVPQLVNADIGPYWISVWTQPDPPTVEDFHLTLALTEPTAEKGGRREAGPPILNALVEVQLRPLGLDPNRQTETLSAIASHENALNKVFYEADLTLPQPGQWEITILVDGPDGGAGTVSFTIEVVEPAMINLVWLVTGGVGVFLGMFFWLMRRSSTGNP